MLPPRNHLTRTVLGAFPTRLADDAEKVLALIPDSRLPPVSHFEVEVENETVAIPCRLYNEEPNANAVRHLTGLQQTMLHCLYSRQSDGHGRQRHLEMIMASTQPWTIPFVMQLAGEHVLEILETMRAGLSDLTIAGSAQRSRCGEFIAHNPAFFARTERRAVSYWDCYYRGRYPEFGTYPGSALLEAFRAAASEHTGTPWPRNTPAPSTRAAEA